MKPLLVFSIFQIISVLAIALLVLVFGIPWTGENFTDLSVNFHLNLVLGICIPAIFIRLLLKENEVDHGLKKIILLTSLAYMAHSTLSGYFTGILSIPLAYYSYNLLRSDA